jgi:hypothetical protein
VIPLEGEETMNLLTIFIFVLVPAFFGESENNCGQKLNVECTQMKLHKIKRQ